MGARDWSIWCASTCISGLFSFIKSCYFLIKWSIFQMAWRYRLGKNLQELRFLYCENSVGSKGVR